MDVIAHCASGADYRRPRRDVVQTRRLVRAASEARPHIVYVSIVGIDQIPFGYFRAKLEAERLIEQSGLPWTILRATQLHDLALMFLMMLVRLPVTVVPRGFQGQPVDTGEVADRMAGLVLGPPAGRVPDLGGPRVEDAEEMVRTFLSLTGRRRPVLRVPMPGRIARGVSGRPSPGGRRRTRDPDLRGLPALPDRSGSDSTATVRAPAVSGTHTLAGVRGCVAGRIPRL